MLDDFVDIGQGSNNGVDTESVQHFCLVSIPNERRNFECIPLGMSK